MGKKITNLQAYINNFDRIFLDTTSFFNSASEQFYNKISNLGTQGLGEKKFIIPLKIKNEIDGLLEQNDKDQTMNRIYFYNEGWQGLIYIEATDKTANKRITDPSPGSLMISTLDNWYYYDLPMDGCEVTFSNGKNKTTPTIFNRDSEYYYKGKWVSRFDDINEFKPLHAKIILARQIYQTLCQNNIAFLHSFGSSPFKAIFEYYTKSHKLLLITQNEGDAQGIYEATRKVNGTKLVSICKITSEGLLEEIEYQVQTTVEVMPTSMPTPTPVVTETNTKELDGEKFPYYDNKPFHGLEKFYTLLPANEVAENETLYTSKSLTMAESFRLGAPLNAGGGEGRVYFTSIKGILCKIYKAHARTQIKKMKLELMVTKKISEKSICWPHKLVYNRQGQFVGLLIPQAKGKEIQKLAAPKSNIERDFGRMTRTDLVKLTITILEKLDQLHKRNILMGDINLGNFLFEDPTTVYLIDTDSYQVDKFPCPVGTEEFYSPEVAKRRGQATSGKQIEGFQFFLRVFQDEYYAVTVLLFKLLMLGRIPYTRITQPGDERQRTDFANAYDFPYSLNEISTKQNIGANSPFLKIWSHFPKYVKEAFINSFDRKGKNSQEGKRMGIDGWLKVMRTYYYHLESGQLAKVDNECNKLYPLNDISYAKVDCQPMVSETRMGGGIKMEEAINKAFRQLNEKPTDEMVRQIVISLNSNGTYSDSIYKIKVEKDIGIAKMVSITKSVVTF